MILQTKSNIKTYSLKRYALSSIQYVHIHSHSHTHQHTLTLTPPPPPHTHTNKHAEAAPVPLLPQQTTGQLLKDKNPSPLAPSLSFSNKSPPWALLSAVLTSLQWPPCPVLIPCVTAPLPLETFNYNHHTVYTVEEGGCLAAAAKAELSYLGINPLLNVVLQVWLWGKKDKRSQCRPYKCELIHNTDAGTPHKYVD